MLAIPFFILGLFVGSFLNVIVDRLPRGDSIFKGRSHCEQCKKTLEWYDLIPLLSFISTKGQCRYCKTKLSWYYPTLELVTGIAFAIVAVLLQNSLFQVASNMYFGNLFFWLLITSCFIVLFFTDLKYGILPDAITYPAILVTFLYLLLTTSYLLLNTLSAFGASLFFFLLFLGTKGKGMGFGDVKLAFLLGLLLGFPQIIIALYIAFISGAIVGVSFVFLKKKKIKGTTIPFGPFLIFGAFATIMWSTQLTSLIRLILH